LLPTCLVLTVVAAAAAAQAPWQTHAPLPDPRTEVAAGIARGEIVVVGGFTGAGGNSPRVDAYSIARDTWRRLPDLPLAVDHAAAASANGTVYIAGSDGPAAEMALKAVAGLGKEVEVGEQYMGTVTRITNFGAFVEILPGKAGLVRPVELSD
jgi:hypothetical protein